MREDMRKPWSLNPRAKVARDEVCWPKKASPTGHGLEHPNLCGSNSYIADGEKQAVNGREGGSNGIS
jgi:hypothetical protein